MATFGPADGVASTMPHHSTQDERQLLQLRTLPPEIITAIFACLVPRPPELGDTRPVSYEKLDEGEEWYDHTRSRRGLWSLCLVSRQLSAIARPLLYRLVAILSEESLFLFLRTLTERPNYGPWTRYLSVHLTLTRESVIRETRRAVGRLLKSFKPASSPPILMDPIRVALEIMAISLPNLSTHDGDFDDVPQVVVSFILMFLTRLETLLLQVPVCDDHPDYDALLVKMAAAREHFRHFGTSPEHAALTPFQNIHTLLLQGDPELLAHYETDDCECTDEIYGAQPRLYHDMFATLPALRTLEVSSDDGAWNSILEEEVLYLSGGTLRPYLAGLREIYLHDSVTCPIHLHQILRNAPNLETLYMTPRIDDRFERRRHHNHSHNNDPIDPMALDVALTNHARNLRELDVAWFDCYGCYDLIGPDGRLASLASNKTLEKLCVQLAVLFGVSAGVNGLPLADLLPPNLVELTLEDWWWSSLDVYEAMQDWSKDAKLVHYRDNAEYRRRAVAMLTQFATGLRARMSRLKKVLLLSKIPYTWEVEGSEVNMAFHFSEVQELFRAQGVDFAVEAA